MCTRICFALKGICQRCKYQTGSGTGETLIFPYEKSEEQGRLYNCKTGNELKEERESEGHIVVKIHETT
jgi:hypothetical protein